MATAQKFLGLPILTLEIGHKNFKAISATWTISQTSRKMPVCTKQAVKFQLVHVTSQNLVDDVTSSISRLSNFQVVLMSTQWAQER